VPTDPFEEGARQTADHVFLPLRIGPGQPAAEHSTNMPTRLEQDGSGSTGSSGNGRRDTGRGSAVHRDVKRSLGGTHPAQWP